MGGEGGGAPVDDAAPKPKRPRGRPPGSLNKKNAAAAAKARAAAELAPAAPARRRRRSRCRTCR